VKGLRSEIHTDAIIDTGFTGDLSLPLHLGIQLGLELQGAEYFELADGSVKRELIFKGIAILEEKELPISICLTESEDALLGVGLLKNQKL